MKKIDRAKSILKDYSKNGSLLHRFFTFHWNRHYIAEVDAVLKEHHTKINSLLTSLKQKVTLKNTLPTHSSILRRIFFIQQMNDRCLTKKAKNHYALQKLTRR